MTIGDLDWARGLLSSMSVEGSDWSSEHQNWTKSSPEETYLGALTRAGYFRGYDVGLENLTARIFRGITELEQQGLPAVMAYLADEPWVAFLRRKSILERALGEGYRMLPAFWAWNVKPGEAGWPPHRDYGRGALAKDGQPLTLTCWIPVTYAHPPSSCVYVLPAHRDPLYRMPTENEPEDWEELLPDVTALTGKPGNWFVWNQALLHWGSRCDDKADARMSIAMEFVRGDPVPEPWKQGHLDHSLPNYNMRKMLIGAQLRRYAHMHEMGMSKAAAILDMLNG